MNKVRRGWAHFFNEGTLFATRADVAQEKEFREAAKRAISDPMGTSLFKNAGEPKGSFTF